MATTKAYEIGQLGTKLTVDSDGDIALNAINGLIVDTSTFTVDPNNNRIGIGVAEPNNTLHVKTSDNVTARFESTTSTAKIQLKDTNNTAFIDKDGNRLGIGFSSAGNQQILFVNNSGDVGIGTASPNTVLEIYDSAPIVRLTDKDGGAYSQISANSSVGGLQLMADHGDTVANSYISFSVDGTTHAWIKDNGRVGIGTNDPQAPLTVLSNSISSSNSGIVVRANSTNNTVAAIGERSGGGGRFHLYDSADNTIALYATSDKSFINTGGDFAVDSDTLYVDASANSVGIGTTAPVRKLHILGSGGTIAAKVEATDGNQASIDLKNSEGEHRLIADGGEIKIYDQTDTAYRWRIDTSGVMWAYNHIKPQTTLSYDLGDSDNRFRDIYLSGQTINMAGTKLTLDSSGDLEIKDLANNFKRIRAKELEFDDEDVDATYKTVLKKDNQGRMVFKKIERSTGRELSDDSDGSKASVDLSSMTTADLTEHTNYKYFTDARARSAMTKATIDALNVNADTVDSLEASQFVRSDTSDTMSGVLTIQSTDDEKLVLRAPSGDTSEWNYLAFKGTDNTRDAYVGVDGDGDLQLVSDKNGNGLYSRGSHWYTDESFSVGTSNTHQTLTVYGNIYLRSNDDITWANGNGTLRVDTSYNMKFSTYDGSSLTEKMRITSAGYVGIATDSPSKLLHVAGEALFDSDVGIGTASPTQKLDIAGYMTAGVNTYSTTIVGNSGGASVHFGTRSDNDSLGKVGTYSSAFMSETVQPNGFIWKKSGTQILRLHAGGILETTNTIRGPSTMTLDPSPYDSDGGTVVIAGNLQVNGTTTTINSTTVEIDDHTLVLASGSSSASEANGAGIVIDGADTAITYDASNDRFSTKASYHIQGRGGSGSYSRFSAQNDSDGSGHAGALAYLQSSGWGEAKLQVGANYMQQSGGKMQFSSGNQKVTWTSIGAFGINVADPLDQLHVSGNIRMQNNNELRTLDTGGSTRTIARVNASNELEYGWSGSGPVKIMGGGSYTERMRIHTDGNIGIGTDNPGHELDVNGDVRIRTNGATIAGTTIANAGLLIGSTTAGMGLDTNEIYTVGDHIYLGVLSSSHDINFRVGAARKMVLKGDTGNVGIGVDSPQSTLQVRSTDRARAPLVLQGSDTNGVVLLAHHYLGSNEYYNTQGMDYSTNAWMIGSGVYVDGATSRKQLSTQDNYTARGASLYVDGANGIIDFYTSNSSATRTKGTENTDITRRLRINANGSVIVKGTDDNSGKADFGVNAGGNPTVSLHGNYIYAGSSDLNYNARWSYNSSSATSDISVWSGNLQFSLFGSGDRDIFFKALDDGTSTEVMRIKGANASVGIGTNNPAYLLDVQGNQVRFRRGAHDVYLNPNYGTLDSFASITTTLDLSFRNGSDQNLMWIDQSGNIGIGTNNPNALLQLTSDGSAAGGAEIRLQHANNNSTDVVSTINFANNVGSVAMIQGGTTGANNTGYISFFTDNAGTSAEKVRILGNGKVGIGTNDPSTNLHVYGSSDPTIRIQGDNSMALHQDAAWNSNIYFGAHHDGSNVVYGASGRGAFRMVNLHDGDTSPQYIAFYGANAGTAGATVSWNSVGFAQDEDGKVGIGTTNPSYKLHVYDTTAGDGSVSGGILIQNAGNATGEAALAIQTQDTGSNKWFLGLNQDNHLAFSYGTSFGDGSCKVNILPTGGVGIGTTDIKAASNGLHVRTGSSGGLTTNAAHDDVIIEGSGNTGINIFSPNTSYQYLAFGDPEGSNTGYVRYYHGGNQMVLRAGGADQVFINSDKVSIGASPASISNSAFQVHDGRVDIATSDTDNGAYRFYQGTTFRGGFGTTNWSGAANSGNNGLSAYATGGDFTIHHNSGTPSARFSDEGHFGLEASDAAANITNGYPKIVYPNVHWSSSGNPSTGAVKIRTPGGLSNYDMCHIILTVYEYTSDAASTIIIGGHNWTSGNNSANAGWHNFNVQVIGSFNKPIYLTQDANDRYIVLGDNNSSWTYGMVSVQRVHGASFYPSGIDWVGDWDIEQTTSATYTWTTANLNHVSSTTLRTPGTFHFAHNSGSGMQIGRSNDSNMFIRTATTGDAGLSLRNSSGAFRSQWYGDGTNYGFLDGDWANWDIKKVINGAMYLNGDNTYFLRPEGTSVFSKLGIGTATVSGATKLHVYSTDNSTNITVSSNSTGGPILYLHSTNTGGKQLGIISNNSSNADGAGLLQFWNATDSHTFATWGTTSGSLSRVYTNLAVAGDTTNSTFTGPGQVALKRSNGNPYLSFHDNAGTRSGYIQSVHSDDLLGFYDFGTYRFQSLAANTTVQIMPTDAGLALLQVGKSTSGTQGTGAVEVTQDGLHGGGISYNGDASPAFVNGETADHIAFYRNDNGTRTEVFKYPYNSNTVTFNGAIELGGDAEHQIQRRTTSAITSGTTDVTEVKGRQIDLYAYDDIWLRAGTGDDIGFVAGGAERLRIASSGNVGIGIDLPQKTLDVLSPNNGHVTVGARTMSVGNYSGIHFGYRENNSSYRKSAIVFERTDNAPGGGGNAAGKIHILNGPETGSGSATYPADAKVTIDEVGNVGIGVTGPTGRLEVHGTNGQLFNVDDEVTGTIFSVADTSGVPSIDVNDDGTVRLAEADGNVLVGDVNDDTVNKLQVEGTIKATAAATLIIYNSAGTAVKTINGINS